MTMAKSRGARPTADEMAVIEDLMSDLEGRLRRLQSSAKREASGASGDVRAFVTQALNDIAARVREGSRNVGQQMTGEAAKFGSDTLKKVTEEVEQRPLLVLAIAAAVGLVLGVMQRR